jgi:hypothetical protein
MQQTAVDKIILSSLKDQLTKADNELAVLNILHDSLCDANDDLAAENASLKARVTELEGTLIRVAGSLNLSA